MSDVFFRKVSSEIDTQTVKEITKELLNRIIEKENIRLEKKIALKVHTGEKGNVTYIKPENFEGIINYLQDKGIETTYIETSVLYGGPRSQKNSHLELANQHGFTQIPFVIADGEKGESFAEVQIDKKRFASCLIGKAFLDYNQIIILSHFKGHALAGFGGAIKQLSMGHASRGGKLAMHTGIKPTINEEKCEKCDRCLARCNENAITIDPQRSFIDHSKCIGCGGCLAACPHGAVTIQGDLMSNLQTGSIFSEKLVEYAYAAVKDKKNIYFNFAMNITKGCDCNSSKMKPLMDDIGIFASTDPVAIDKVCYDLVKEKGTKFKGFEQFAYAEQIGLGSTKYNLIEV